MRFFDDKIPCTRLIFYLIKSSISYIFFESNPDSHIPGNNHGSLWHYHQIVHGVDIYECRIQRLAKGLSNHCPRTIFNGLVLIACISSRFFAVAYATRSTIHHNCQNQNPTQQILHKQILLQILHKQFLTQWHKRVEFKNEQNSIKTILAGTTSMQAFECAYYIYTKY
jgi:hypothetical protein